MNFLKSIFTKKEKPIQSYHDFWNWFQQHEKSFFKVVKEKSRDIIEKKFFDIISPKLNELKDGIWFETGMNDDNTAELILTADGCVKNMVFVEELMQAAPAISGWLFTALKPQLNIEDVNIDADGYLFTRNNLNFFANYDRNFPDEIDISVIYNGIKECDKSEFKRGVYLFLDSFLGELNFATTIDELNVVGNDNIKKELIPIEKLKDYLIWREKEFVEKYEGIRHKSENDNFAVLEAKLKNGKPMIAVINKDLLAWDRKASHPWILKIEIKYDGKNHNGMPDNKTFDLLDKIENELLDQLKDSAGYLNIGRQTADGVREIYFACREFRKPSKVAFDIAHKYSSTFTINYDIYKDKYWRSFNRFGVQ